MRRFPAACGFEVLRITRGCGFRPPESPAHSGPHHAEVIPHSWFSVGMALSPNFLPHFTLSLRLSDFNRFARDPRERVTVRRECGGYSRRAVRLASRRFGWLGCF
jgi:hypothetical protein